MNIHRSAWGLIALLAIGSADAHERLAQHEPDTRQPDSAGASDTQSTADGDDARLIRSAMQAAPPSVASKTKIIVLGADGRARLLQQGSNGFTCMPDNPTTPGPDPMCMDNAAMEWANAWMAKKPPQPGKIGFMYMLAGGTDASNTDPFATRPTQNNHWVKTGPHVMIVGATSDFYDMYPKDAQPDTSVPYVMWPGTPYQHLMIPVR